MPPPDSGVQGVKPPASLERSKHLRKMSRPKGKRRLTAKPRGPNPDALFKPGFGTFWQYKRKLADCLEDIAGELRDVGTRQSFLRRALAVRACCTRTKARLCGELVCAAPIPGSGRIDNTSRGIKACNARTCTGCQRRKAQKLRAWLELAVPHVSECQTTGYAWRFLTGTAQYDPADPECVSSAGLRKRAQGLKKAFKAAWNQGLKRPGTAMFYSVEIAGTGNVHIHALYFGPFINQEWFNAVGRDAFPGFGYTWFEYLGADPSERVAEVAKYCAKGTSIRHEDYLNDTAGQNLHPLLAARWELATFHERLQERYGSFREVPKPDDEPAEEIAPPDDAATPCRSCGVIGPKIDGHVKTIHYIKFCHLLGEEAFPSGGWIHPSKRPTQRDEFWRERLRL
jgi:hypothetical protein